MKTLSRDDNSQSSNVLTTTGDEVALSLVPTDVYADMVTDISPYFLNPTTANKHICSIYYSSYMYIMGIIFYQLRLYYFHTVHTVLKL